MATGELLKVSNEYRWLIIKNKKKKLRGNVNFGENIIPFLQLYSLEKKSQR